MGATTVVLDGQEYKVPPRTRTIVKWLLQRAAQIDTAHHLFSQLLEGLQDIVLTQMRALVQMQRRGEPIKLGTMLATAPGYVVAKRD